VPQTFLYQVCHLSVDEPVEMEPQSVIAGQNRNGCLQRCRAVAGINGALLDHTLANFHPFRY
jgi:hypothetical protein